VTAVLGWAAKNSLRCTVYLSHCLPFVCKPACLLAYLQISLSVNVPQLASASQPACLPLIVPRSAFLPVSVPQPSCLPVSVPQPAFLSVSGYLSQPAFVPLPACLPVFTTVCMPVCTTACLSVCTNA
jgi:hypothetical protein